ncbi:Pc22g05780 [Rhizoctonia solani AG-1 IB]|uniref:Pc22g05780 n=1 Tax=Thanatephorus cucumeris (strain AG1-IB / isolate 7/3/14) TaxID=1108050 RepID=M5BYN3_THACB|nr:hypothetical protein BN14_06363 [Rhizoctonia solani AG-1 IB]CEL63999.1 Pc22g05780 [Rhizoctonia solani AG-1 IB]
MPSQNTPSVSTSYSLATGRERRSTQGNRPERARPALEEIDRLKERRAKSDSQREVRQEIATRPRLDESQSPNITWPKLEKPPVTGNREADKKALAHAYAKYYCKVVAYWTGINIYPRYQLGELSPKDVQRMAFPDGIIYNAANIPARLDLQDRLPPLLAEKLSGDKMAPVTSEPSTPHAQFGSQYTGSERAVVTGPSGESMYPGITRRTGTSQEVQSRFAKSGDKRSTTTGGSTQAALQARSAGHPPLIPTDSQTYAANQPVYQRNSANNNVMHALQSKATKINPAKQLRKQVAGVDHPPTTSASRRGNVSDRASTATPTASTAPPSRTTMPSSHVRLPGRELLTAKASNAPKPGVAYSTPSPMTPLRRGGAPAPKSVKPGPRNIASANNQFRSVVVHAGGTGIDNRHASPSASISSTREDPRLCTFRQPRQPQVEQSPPVAAELVDEDEEMDTGFLDQEPLADEGMKCEWDDGIAVDDTPPDVLTKTPAVRSEIMTDKITGRSVRRMIVDPDALPDARNSDRIAAYPPLLHEALKLLVKISKPVRIANGTYDLETSSRAVQIKTMADIDADAWIDVQVKLNTEIAFDHRYLNVITPQITAFRTRTFRTLEGVVSRVLGFDMEVMNGDMEGRVRNVRLYKRYKNFGFIFAFPETDGEPFNSEYILQAILATAYANRLSFGYKEQDLFSVVPGRFMGFICTLTFHIISLFNTGVYPAEPKLNQRTQTAVFQKSMEYVEQMEQQKAEDWLEINAKIIKTAKKLHTRDQEPLPEGPTRDWSPDGSLRRKARFINHFDDRSRHPTPAIEDGRLNERTDIDRTAPEIDMSELTTRARRARSPAGDYGSDGVLTGGAGAYEIEAGHVPSPPPLPEDIVESPPEELIESDDCGDGELDLF